MIIISAGMQKAGTGWYFNMINDILVAAGHQNVRQIRERYRLHSILKYQNCNMGRLLFPKFALLMLPHISGHTFVVKTHEAPTPTLRLLTKAKITKSLYIYRDPRDAAVSAFEHGVKLRKAGETHSFARLETPELAIQAARRWCSIWEAWSQFPSTLLVKYESLVHNPRHEIARLVEFLGVNLSLDVLDKIVTNYQRDRTSDKSDILHFNKGIIGRYREILTREQQELCQTELNSFLSKMGYQ
ncbi:hypothetical protein D6779_03200 [Candidatus Parcubacteria bacterium]|nr:MAG: hypothetical protein D6779_03200 [Candidatus Parcubacteria bacterium]